MRTSSHPARPRGSGSLALTKRVPSATGGYSADHPVIKVFWRVVEGFTDEEKRKLLKFVTSCSRPPLLGFKVRDSGPLPSKARAAEEGSSVADAAVQGSDTLYGEGISASRTPSLLCFTISLATRVSVSAGSMKSPRSAPPGAGCALSVTVFARGVLAVCRDGAAREQVTACRADGSVRCQFPQLCRAPQAKLSKTRARNVGRVCLERVMCEQKCGFPWMSPKLFHVTTFNHQHRSQTTQPDIFSNLNVNLNLQRISVAVNENEQHRSVEAAVLTQGDTSSAQGRGTGHRLRGRRPGEESRRDRATAGLVAPLPTDGGVSAEF